MVSKFKVSGQLMTSEVRSNTSSGPRLSSGRYKIDRNAQIGAKLRLNTLKHPEIDIRRIFGHSRSFEVSDLI